MIHKNGEVESIYRDRAERFAEERDRQAALSRRLGHGRLAAFACAAALLLVPFPPIGTGPRLIGAVVFLLAFVALVVRQRRLERRRTRFDELRAINEEAIHRVRRQWSELPEHGPVDLDDDAADADHAYAADLDVFGRASLFQLLWSGGTTVGRRTLVDWLRQPAAPDEIRARQEAVAELAPRLELRQVLSVRSRRSSERPETTERFLSWAEDEPWLSHEPLLVWAARILPAITITAVLLHAFGVWTYHGWAIAGTAAFILTFGPGKRVRETLARVSAREGALRSYAGLIQSIETASFEAGLLRTFQSELGADGVPAHEQMERLGRLATHADLRYSMSYLPVQLLTLWDYHVLFRLERWQRTAGPHARRWLSALGAVEALAALAGLRHDNPDWTFPEMRDEPVLEARNLAHPLLARRVRVANDVTLGPPGSVLLVTGSNMSGKSTLLRTIGTNAVLAQAGGPVCATSMRLPPVTIHTSMRVHDSLERGLSHFMAELKRLRRIVETARRASDGGGPVVLYLLDDILQGTNHEERRIAVRRIIVDLLEESAIGAITTHDLQLAETEQLSDACRATHFTETVHEGDGDPSISFDYRLRPGVTRSRNALKLLRMAGLDPVRREP